MIPLSVPNLTESESSRVEECVRSGWVSSAGPWVRSFEEGFAASIGAPSAVAVSTGTAALHLALLAANVSPGDLVIVPTLTFIASVNVIRYVGADPVFIGTDSSHCLDLDSVRAFMNTECELRAGDLIHRSSGRKVSAIIPVHLFGFLAPVEELMHLCDGKSIQVIEDAAESLGTVRVEHGSQSAQASGLFGHFGCFSFNGNKIMTTGSGGMVVARSPDALRKVRYLSTQAKDDELFFVHDEVGFNYRMASVNAALGTAQLERLPEFIARKRDVHARYAKAFYGLKLGRLLSEREGTRSNYWLNTFEFNSGTVHDLERRINFFKDYGIEARPAWKLNHLQRPYLNATRFQVGGSENLYPRILNLPSSTGITNSEVETVIDAVVELEKCEFA